MKTWSSGEKVNASDLNENFTEALRNIEQFVAGEDISAGDAVCLKADGKVYKAQASDKDRLNFVGIAYESQTSGNNISVQTKGKRGGLSLTLSETITETTFKSQTSGAGLVVSHLSVKTPWQGFISKRFGSPLGGPGNISKVSLYMYKNGSPAGNFTVSIYEADENGEPTGNALGSVTEDATNVSSGAWHDFTFTTPIEIKPDKVYVIQVNFSSLTTNDSSNYLGIYYESPGSYEGNSYGKDSGNITFKDSNHEWRMQIYTTKKVYAEKGDLIYVSDTAGQLSLLPGTYRVVVGTIIDANNILVNHYQKKVIARYGILSIAGTYVYLPLPKDATMVIMEFYSGVDEGAVGEVVLTRDYKTSGMIQDHYGNGAYSDSFELDTTNFLSKGKGAFSGRYIRATYLT